jgi:hypothetical protein
MGRQRQLNRLRTSTKHLLSVFYSDPFTLRSRSQGNPDCGRRTSTVSSCAFREQRDLLAGRPSNHCPALLNFIATAGGILC